MHAVCVCSRKCASESGCLTVSSWSGEGFKLELQERREVDLANVDAWHVRSVDVHRCDAQSARVERFVVCRQ